MHRITTSRQGFKPYLTNSHRANWESDIVSGPALHMATVDIKNPEINNVQYRNSYSHQQPHHLNNMLGHSGLTRKDKKIKEEKKKLTKDDIGMPINIQHIGPVGWDPNTGFAVNNLDPELKNPFDMCGISESQLKDRETSKVIYDFNEKKGFVAALKNKLRRQAPPPPPSHGGPPHPPPMLHRPGPPPPPPPPTPSKGCSRVPTPPHPSRMRRRAPPPFPPPPPPPTISRGHLRAPSPSKGRRRAPPPPSPSRGCPRVPTPPHPSRLRRRAPPPFPPPPPPPTISRGHLRAPPPAPSSSHSIAPKALPPPPPSLSHQSPLVSGGGSVPAPPLPPPPPPPSTPPPPPELDGVCGGGNYPHLPRKLELLEQIRGGTQLKKVEQNQRPPASGVGRDALLDRIRQGIQLKNVSDHPESSPLTQAPTAAIVGALMEVMQKRSKAIHSSDEDEDDEGFRDAGDWDD